VGGAVGIGRRDQRRQSLSGHFVGRLERGGERSEIDLGTESPHGVDRRQDVAAGLTLDEWFDGELDPQHAPSVIAQSRPITRRSSPARTLQSRPAMSNASAKRVSAERNEPFQSLSKA
jgi:hypothetical protein